MEKIRNYGDDPGYVNIHGSEIRVCVCEKTGRILIPIEELHSSGFRIYPKSQYNKIFVDEKQFKQEFDLFLLERAQSYMLEHKIVFKEAEIYDSIRKCKQALIGGSTVPKSPQTPKNHLSPENGKPEWQKSPRSFTSSHIVEPSDDGNITVTTLRQPSPATVHNMQSSTKFQGFTQNRNPAATVRKEEDNFNVSSKENYEPKNRNSSLNQKWGSPKASMENLRNQDRKSLSNGRDTDSPKEVLERLPSIDLDQSKEHDVLISFIETKPNFLWVQDISKPEVLLDITKRIAEEVETAPQHAGPYVYNKIYLAEYEGDWCRCKIIKFKPPIVFFVDFGNTAPAGKVMEASESLSKIPGQAARIKYKSDFTPQVNQVVRLKIQRRIDDGTYFGELTLPSEATPSAPATPPPKTFFTLPPHFGVPETGQRVQILHENNGQLALRIKESFEKLRQIEQVCSEVELLPLENPQEKQLVLYKTDKVYRGQIKEMGKELVVKGLDYCDDVRIQGRVYHIPEALAAEPLTWLLSPRLRGYTDKGKQIIEKMINEKQKGTVVMSNGQFDLKIGDGLLSQLINPPSVPMIEQFKPFKPQLGKGSYFLNVYSDVDHVFLGDKNAFEAHIGTVVLESVDGDPYEPIVGEVCYGFYQDSWCRCVVKRAMTTRFEVQFIDFGNMEILNADQLRKAGDDVRSIPALAIHCSLTGLPVKDPEILKDVFKEKEGSDVDVDIKEFDGLAYKIEIPSVYDELRAY